MVAKPLAVTFGTRKGSTAFFITRKGECTITDHVDTIFDLLPHCNGFNTIEEIAKIIGLPQPDAQDLIEALAEFEIVADSSRLYRIFYEDLQLDSPYRNSLDPGEANSLMSEVALHRRKTSEDPVSTHDNLVRALLGRGTSRSFDSESRISKDSMFAVLKYMYFANGRSTVPSAGSIYPLDFYVIVLQDIGSVKAGIYQYDTIKSRLNKINIGIDIEKLRFIFGDKSVLEGAQLIVCVAADINAHASKYGNRGFAFTYIEVGHVAQNLQLLCYENNLGILECGGFIARYLDRSIGLTGDDHILLTFIIGVPKTDNGPSAYEENLKAAKRLWHLVDNHVGQSHAIKWLDTEILTYRDHYMPRITCVASYGQTQRSDSENQPRDTLFAFATGYSTAEAATKVIAEAIERHASGNVRVDIRGSLGSLNRRHMPAIDPNTIYRVNPAWYERETIKDRYEQFLPDKVYEWTFGNRLSNGEKTAIIIDQIYYPLDQKKLGRKLLYNVSSSGVAAHFELDDARKRALLELIERDAISVLWYADKELIEIPYDVLPADVRGRCDYWRSDTSNQLKFLDISLDTSPTVLVLMKRTSYPYFVVGAASDFYYEDAIMKAFDEMEATMLSWLKEKHAVVEESSIESPHNHGIFYAHPGAHNNLDWLFRPTQKITKFQNYQGGLSDLALILDPYEVILRSAEDNNDLWVVRMLSKRLLTLNFGYGNDPDLTPRLNALKLKPRWKNYPAPPHFFP